MKLIKVVIACIILLYGVIIAFHKINMDDPSSSSYGIKIRAIMGSTKAQNELGTMYFRGNGVSQNYSKAAKWYRKAASKGDAISQINLSIMYFNGKGVPKDYSEAIAWVSKAANQGNAEAQYYFTAVRLRT